METFRSNYGSFNFHQFQRSRVVLSVGNNLWKRVGRKFSTRSLWSSRLNLGIDFFSFSFRGYFVGIAKGSIVRMKGVTRFERCSCWPEMIDRGALLAGTDLPLPVALPPPSLKQAPDNWKHLDIFFFFFLRNDGYFYIVYMEFHRFCYCGIKEY